MPRRLRTIRGTGSPADCGPGLAPPPSPLARVLAHPLLRFHVTWMLWGGVLEAFPRLFGGRLSIPSPDHSKPSRSPPAAGYGGIRSFDHPQ